MTKTEKRELEVQRQKAALKNTLFNRYLLFRYSLALFFFTNLYWLIIQFIQPSLYMIMPAILLVFTILASAEQFRLYGNNDEPNLKWTKRVFIFQLLSQFVCLSLIAIAQQFTVIFPIFANKQAAQLFVAGMLLLGAALCLFNLKRLDKITHHADRAYKRYQAMLGQQLH